MKYLEITEQTLNEINMSPGALSQAAKKINALAGMEFEMIVPGAKQAEDYEPEWVADYDRDTRTRRLSDVLDFFDDGDYNSRSDINTLREQIYDEFHDWRGEKLQEFWNDNKENIIKEYLRNNAKDDDDNQLEGDALDKRVEKAIEEINEDHDEAQQDYMDDPENYDAEEYDVDDFLTDKYPYMTDIENNFDIQWTHYYDENEGSYDNEISVDDIADEFSRMIGKPVNASNNYHGARREAGHYVVEPDGSLEGDDDEDGGLEFVSPPLPLDELLSDLQKVKDWAKKKGCYTNDSTGLHINISIPDSDFGNLDYVKLAILLGDEYVLKEFGRTSNHFCQSALKIVKKNIQQRPDDVAALLEQMKEHLSTAASRAIHSGTTSKYTSINTKTGYVEFRSPGGDWLNNTFDKIVPTLLRFVVALDAAMDETAYKEEYAKKLYKLLAPSDDETNTLKFFAQYSAGELPRSALASFVRQAQLKRKVNKGNTSGKKYWWKVGRPGYGASVDVVATSKEEAIELGKKEYPEWDYSTDMTAEPLRPYEGTPGYEIFNLNTNRSIETADGITNDRDALIRLDDYIHHGPHSLQPGQARNMFGIRRIGGDGEPILAQPIRAAVYTPYEIVNQNGDTTVGLVASSEQNALERFNEYRAQHGQQYGLNRGGRNPAAIVRPGANVQSPQGEWTGWWIIKDANGAGLHRFNGVGNVQADANRVALRWLIDNGYGHGHEVSVVPEMR
jgi:hypothetical protein